MACGSVDDGKSTLVGRLVHASNGVFDDELRVLREDSRQFGTQRDNVDYALLLDGLQAEREQGITIDVAYRHFASARRRFIVADAPGHEQYTRNMATAASTAGAALALVDVRRGMGLQTKRHLRIAAMMGVRRVALAVNKMDLVAFDADAFACVAQECARFAADLGFQMLDAIPVCAVEGDNVAARSERMSWYGGRSVLEWLDQVPLDAPPPTAALRLPVQWVARDGSGFRGLCGRIAAGRLAPGDAVQVMPSRARTRVTQVWIGMQAVASADAGDSVCVTLADPVDAGRGDVLAGPDASAQAADQFEARILWLNERPLIPGRGYLLKIHAKETGATVTSIRYRDDADSGAQLAARVLGLNEMGMVTLSTTEQVVYEPYASNRPLGAFILIDRLTMETLGAGMIDFALRRAANLPWQAVEVERTARARLKGQAPRCVWFTGLSGSGKSTLANLLEKRLHGAGRHTYLLDGDNLRHGLNRDLGFTDADRVENVRRVTEVARLMVDAGLVVIVSLISPFRAERRAARQAFGPGEFVEVFVDTPLDECERRDPKGLYAKARRGELMNFTGIDSGYEPPEAPEVRIDTQRHSPAEGVEAIIAILERHGSSGS